MDREPHHRNGVEHWFAGKVYVSALNYTIENIIIAARDHNDATRRFERRARHWTWRDVVCKETEMMMPLPGETFEEQKQRLSAEGFLIL